MQKTNKNLKRWAHSREEGTEERISEYQYRTIQVTQYKQQRENILKKINQ